MTWAQTLKHKNTTLFPERLRKWAAWKALAKKGYVITASENDFLYYRIDLTLADLKGQEVDKIYGFNVYLPKTKRPRALPTSSKGSK